jgi:hypothetical protein
MMHIVTQHYDHTECISDGKRRENVFSGTPAHACAPASLDVYLGQAADVLALLKMGFSTQMI